ncbi:hypothetical protein JXJ21_13015 [candidate division KSB1 bacterium]|nr:hypothetical protein [candidate division KSB1 bacterium]
MGISKDLFQIEYKCRERIQSIFARVYSPTKHQKKLRSQYEFPGLKRCAGSGIVSDSGSSSDSDGVLGAASSQDSFVSDFSGTETSISGFDSSSSYQDSIQSQVQVLVP